MARIQELTMARGNRVLLLIALLAGLISAILVFVTLANSESDSGTSNIASQRFRRSRCEAGHCRRR